MWREGPWGWLPWNQRSVSFNKSGEAIGGRNVKAGGHGRAMPHVLGPVMVLRTAGRAKKQNISSSCSCVNRLLPLWIIAVCACFCVCVSYQFAAVPPDLIRPQLICSL